MTQRKLEDAVLVGGHFVPDELVAAIENSSVVVLRYQKNTETSGERTVHPHVLYATSAGTVCVHAVQVDGPTSGNESLPFWRPFNVDHIEIVAVKDEVFTHDKDLNLANRNFYKELVVDCVNGRH